MIDGYGRTIDYVRISVTDRCNLRCVYCMPEEGIGSISHEEILRFGEIERVCQILAENGIQKIKLTGGEPLVRRRLPELAAALKQIPGIKSLTITTNGVLLEEMYDALADAGVDSVTISLDTLDASVYRQLTRRTRSSDGDPERQDADQDKLCAGAWDRGAKAFRGGGTGEKP